jgi:hypothetical protein
MSSYNTIPNYPNYAVIQKETKFYRTTKFKVAIAVLCVFVIAIIIYNLTTSDAVPFEDLQEYNTIYVDEIKARQSANRINLQFDIFYRYLTISEAAEYNKLYEYVISTYRDKMTPENASNAIQSLQSAINTATRKSQLYNVTFYMANNPNGSLSKYKYGRIVGIETLKKLTNKEQVEYFSDLMYAIDKYNFSILNIMSVIVNDRNFPISHKQMSGSLLNYIDEMAVRLNIKK